MSDQLVHICFSMLATVIGILTVGQAGADGGLRERFLQDAPRGWQALRSNAENVEGSYVETRTTKAPPNTKSINREAVVRRFDYKFRRDAGLALVELARVSDPGLKGVVGANPAYSFTLTRNAEHAPFAVINYRKTKDGEDAVIPEPGRVPNHIYYLEVPYRISQFTMQEILDTPEFQLSAIAPVARATNMMVRVEFRWETDNPEYRSKDGSAARYWAIMNPDDYWSVQQSGADISWGTITQTIEYQRLPNGMPFPKRLIRFDADSSGTYGNHCEVVYDLPTIPCDEPREAFTLTAYGISENIGADATVSRRFWLTVLGLGGILIAAVLAYLARRRSRYA